MRLKRIKLAGFKSFVDPTALDTPSQLVGVVGPNGCGKSNVIDAVRWVLGESKASELRGESMQDVIFNGAAERKPAARASVELIFDNSLGRIGGSWGSYAEISVKRILGRDGQSIYQINNQSVRRRDVYDMFLGTGLGPRAYAIIGQGMISRIIEAKPEELRVFLEEAAGVSKYKERRRETENRLSGTRENLTRVDDILRELNGQIEKLEQQAEVAQQFRSFEAERERKQQMLWIVRRDEGLAEQARYAGQLAAATVALEARVAELRAIEAEVESLRADHYAAGDEVHKAQGAYYEVNAEVSRLESEIKYIIESQSQTRERIATLIAQVEQAHADQTATAEAAQTAAEELAAAEERAEQLAQRLVELGDRQPELEGGLREARAALDSAREKASQTSSAIERSAALRSSAQAQLEQAERRRERLISERQAVDAPQASVLEEMREQLEQAEAAEHQTAEQQQDAEAEWTRTDAERAPAQQEARTAEAKLAQLQARHLALRQLQERVQSQDRIAPWLARHGLDRLGRLWQQLRIDHGWESAIESVLRERTSALKVETVDRLAALAEDAPPARVAFFAGVGLPGQGTAGAAASPAAVGLQTLLSHVHCSDAGVQAAMAAWLHGIYVADSLESAAARRGDLPPGGSFVTRQGHVLDRASIRLYAADSEQDGILARQFEIDNLEREQRAQELLTDQARDHAVRVEAIANQRLVRLNQSRDEHNQAIRRLTSIKLEAERLAQLSQRVAMTHERVDNELAEVDALIERARQTMEEEAERFDQLDVELADRQQQTEELVEAFGRCEQTLARHREEYRMAEREAQEASFATREIQGRIERLKAQAEQAVRLIAQAGSERGLLDEKLAQLSDSAAQASLQEILSRRQAAEMGLNQARSRLDDLSARMRQQDEQRLQIERSIEPMRGRLSEFQLKEQAAALGAQQFAEQLGEAKVDEATVRAGFAELPRPSWLQGEVTRLGNLIQGLGAVNLAALDELAQSSERKVFLDSQSKDLNEAIATLEDAIRRIDKETREVLQGTYDQVNSHFGQLFPELFGGGDAKLVLTGDEILDSGIQVMAHPPGKRNASIHLLSGGEKALTAIALVFALFQLNPAPFCLLDEVDAPLDDANTERYCDMVRRMSDQTQFLFITHNKIAMELAQQLVGVTMQERGVSRIVAVDLESATQLAEAA